MQYNLDKLIDRSDTNSVKWEFISSSVEGADEDTLPLWVADMDFPCADPIIKAMEKRIDRKIFGYSLAYSEEYLNSVSNWFSKRYSWNISMEEICVSPGVVPAIGFLIRALTKQGEGVIIQRPVYYPFTNMIINNKRKLVNNPLINNKGRYEINFEDLEGKAKDPNNKMLLLCSPHNPVGRVWTKEELLKIGQICLDNGVIIVSDEIHCDLTRKNVHHIPISTLFDTEQIITCTAVSKTFNLAGLQISNIIIKSKAYRKLFNEEIESRTGLFGSNPFAIVSTIAAYNEGYEWLTQAKAYIDDNLKFAKEFLEENLPKAIFFVPEGTYLAWVDLRAYGYNFKELKELMIKKAKVALDEGFVFGEEGEGFERINVACQRSILEACLNRMTRVLLADKP